MSFGQGKRFLISDSRWVAAAPYTLHFHSHPDDTTPHRVPHPVHTAVDVHSALSVIDIDFDNFHTVVVVGYFAAADHHNFRLSVHHFNVMGIH